MSLYFTYFFLIPGFKWSGVWRHLFSSKEIVVSVTLYCTTSLCIVIFLTCVCTCVQRAQQQTVITSYLLKLEHFEHTPLWSQSSWNTHTNGSAPHGIQYLGQVLTLFVSHFSECSYVFIFLWPLPHMSCVVIHNLKGPRGSMCNLYKQFLRPLSSLKICLISGFLNLVSTLSYVKEKSNFLLMRCWWSKYVFASKDTQAIYLKPNLQ